MENHQNDTDRWGINKCLMNHTSEEKAVLKQLYDESQLPEDDQLYDESQPTEQRNITKIFSLLQSATFSRVPVDHTCNCDVLTTLELACSQGRVDLVGWLLDHGADVHGTKRNERSLFWRPLHLACQSEADTHDVCKVVRLLVARGANVEDPDGENWLPLMHATSSNQTQVVEFLLSEGADPNASGPSWRGSPPLIWACRFMPHETDYVSPKIVHRLLQAGADPDFAGMQQCCIVQVCCALDVEKLLLLLAYRARLEQVSVRSLKSLMKEVLHQLQAADDSLALERTDRYSTVMDLLLAAGWKPSIQERKPLELEALAIECGETDASSTASCDFSREVKRATLELLKASLAAPQPLKGLCRRAIRSCVSPDIDVHLCSLPVPASVQSFLRFGDIAVRTTYGEETGVTVTHPSTSSDV